jgi:hypothetical protein
MFDIYFILSFLLFAALCFVEFIVFNEEVLLALCFFSFIFFSFNSLGDTFFNIFNSRANKFESELLTSFHAKKQTVYSQSVQQLRSRGFSSKFKVFACIVNNYLSLYSAFCVHQLNISFLNNSLIKLGEMSLFEQQAFATFRKKCSALLLYPLIFQTVKDNVLFLSSISMNKKRTSKTTSKLLVVLRHLCFQ